MSGYGMKGHAMVQFQNSFGTALVDSLDAMAVTEASLAVGIDQLMEQGMYGRFDEGPNHHGQFNVSGNLALEASPISLGYLMKSTIGYTSATSAAGSVSHTFKPMVDKWDGMAALPPMTVEQHLDVGSAMLFWDMCGNTFSLNVANGELLNATLGLVGGNFSRQAASTPVFPTAKPFKWDQFSGSFNGAVIEDLLDLTLTVNNNLAPRWTLQNTASPRKIVRSGFRTIELTGTMLFQTHSLYDAFLAQSSYPMVLNFAGAQSPNVLKLDMPAIIMKTYAPVLSSPGVIEAAFTAKVEYHSNSATALDVTIVNTQGGYLTPIV